MGNKTREGLVEDKDSNSPKVREHVDDDPYDKCFAYLTEHSNSFAEAAYLRCCSLLSLLKSSGVPPPGICCISNDDEEDRLWMHWSTRGVGLYVYSNAEMVIFDAKTFSSQTFIEETDHVKCEQFLLALLNESDGKRD